MSNNEAVVYQTKSITNGTIGYVKLGFGRVSIVMLVGYTGTLFHWNRQFVNKLAEKYTVYLVDNRYVGLSNTNNEDGIIGMAHDVADFIDCMKLNKPWVLGWSMGGVITQELARFCKMFLSGIVLMSSMPSNVYVNVVFMLFMAEADSLSKGVFKNKLYQFFFSEGDYANKIYLLKDNALNFSNYDFRYSDKAKLFQDNAMIMWDGLSKDKLSQLDLPILQLWAKDDRVVSYSAQEYILKYAPNATLIEYEDGGHFLIHKRPEEVSRDIINFIEKH